MGYRAARWRTLVILPALAASLPALIAIAPTVSASPGTAAHATAAAARQTRTQTLCKKDEHVTVKSRWGRGFVVRNDFFRNPGCLTNWNLRPNFRVTTSYRATPSGKVVSFPDIFRGCAWGTCSPDPKMPARISSLRTPQATWKIKHAWSGGRWNAAFDIWIGKHKMTTGQAEGAELMVWLRTHDLPSARGWPIVWVGHRRYYLLNWIASLPTGQTWNYIQFRRFRQTNSVRHLSIQRFIRKAENRGLIKPWWWLENIEAGFEIWWGGKGLGTRKFWAKP